METSAIIQSLRALRQEIEREADRLTAEQVFLLTDVCGALGLSNAQTFNVVGQRYAELVMGPTPYHLTESFEAISVPEVNPFAPGNEELTGKKPIG